MKIWTGGATLPDEDMNTTTRHGADFEMQSMKVPCSKKSGVKGKR
jgi:hypothetical protein